MNEKKQNIDFIRNSPFVTIVFRLNTKAGHYEIIKASDAAAEYLGFASGQKKDIDYLDLRDFWIRYIHPEDLGRIFHYAQNMIDNPGQSVSFTCRLKKNDGKYEWSAGFVKPKIIGNVMYAYASFFPITDIELLDQELWTHSLPAHLVLEDVLGTTAFPIYWTDQELRFLGANQAMLSFFNIPSREEILGKNLKELHIFPDAIVDKIVRKQKNVLKNRRTVHGEREIVVGNHKLLVSYIESPMEKEGKVIGLVGSFQDVTMQRKTQERLKVMADIDYLTKLPNRRAFYTYAQTARIDYDKSGLDFAIMMIDLNHFKSVNDKYGHEIGDFVLSESARKMKSALGQGGILCRFGGDEFIAVVPLHPNRQMDKIAEELDASVRTITEYQGKKFKLSASVGYALYSETKNIEQTVEEADKRMYAVKKARKAERK